METYITILNLIVAFGIFFLAYRIFKLTNERDKLEKQLEETTKECRFWKNKLKNYLS